MINLKITMTNEDVYTVANKMIGVDTVQSFIKIVLMPQRVQLNWYQVIPGNWIQVSNIVSIVELSEEDVNRINNEYLESGDEIIMPEDLPNVELD